MVLGKPVVLLVPLLRSLLSMLLMVLPLQGSTNWLDSNWLPSSYRVLVSRP